MFKNLYYKYKLGVLGGLFCQIDYVLDKALRDCMNSGLKSIESEEHDQNYSIAQFNNGIIFAFWNANKYYAWMKDGCIIFTDVDESGGRKKYRYEKSRPTVKTMYEFTQSLNKFEYSPVEIKNNPFDI